jgi:hypothetical protein
MYISHLLYHGIELIEREINNRKQHILNPKVKYYLTVHKLKIDYKRSVWE